MSFPLRALQATPSFELRARRSARGTTVARACLLLLIGPVISRLRGAASWVSWRARLTALVVLGFPAALTAAQAGHDGQVFPPELSSYASLPGASLIEVLKARIQAEPFNLLGTIFFLLAIVHTFLASSFTALAHRYERQHQLDLEQAVRDGRHPDPAHKSEVSFKAQVFHFLGEVEAIFGIWVVPLLLAMTLAKGWPITNDYFSHHLNFTEPLFVVVVMAMAASKPIVRLAERVMAACASAGRHSAAAWWLSILTVGPLLGSLITEPAAMTISALLLARKFYLHHPTPALAYATLGLLFVNVSVGGTLTHFAAPPVLMVAGRWGWGLPHMLIHFGWKAALGIAAANTVYFMIFRREFERMAASRPGGLSESSRRPIPAWITTVHILFLAWTILNNHSPALFIGGFLFYLAFTQATEHHQENVRLRPALLVGFFLAGLVVHGGLQGWWIQPFLSRLGEWPLFFGAVALTAFNDNAAITYLASLVPGFSPALKYAVVAGAVVGGGLTVIANAPNPAGQSILAKFFPNGVSAGRLALGALLPTVLMALVFLLL
jgi:hypothetical protein